MKQASIPPALFAALAATVLAQTVVPTSAEPVTEFSISLTSPLMRAMMSPLRSSLKKESGRERISERFFQASTPSSQLCISPVKPSAVKRCMYSVPQASDTKVTMPRKRQELRRSPVSS